jgi:hypothetical protein
MIRWLSLGGALIATSFFAGALTAHDRPSATGAAAVAASSSPLFAAPIAVAQQRSAPAAHPPRFTPPPIPEEDPGVAEMVHHPDPPAGALEQRYLAADRQLDHLFGSSFPQAKRAAIKAALKTWMTDHAHAVRDYYTGQISKSELALRIHQEMLAWSAGVQSALSPDEYRRYADLEPNADPYVQLVGPNAELGDTLPGISPPGGADPEPNP